MDRLVGMVRRGQRLSLLTARKSQALVIAATDQLARHSDTGRPRVIGRVWASQLNLTGVLGGEPIEVADEAYRHVQRLVELHREFVHRLFEAIDTRDLLPARNPGSSNVIPMRSRPGM